MAYQARIFITISLTLSICHASTASTTAAPVRILKPMTYASTTESRGSIRSGRNLKGNRNETYVHSRKTRL